MSTEDRERLRRVMGEVSVLSPGDPQRQVVEAEVAQVGGWAEEEWLDLLHADEQLRLALRRVPTPPGLEEHLLAIPDELPRRRFVGRRWLGVGAVAALALVAVGLLGFLKVRQSGREQTLAQLAVSNHLKDVNDPHLTIESGDRSVVTGELASLVPFTVRIPDLGPSFRLLGGKKCKFGAQAIVYTQWERAGNVYSLHQFCTEDFGLSPAVSRRVVVLKEAPAPGGTREVLLWARGGDGFALVGENGAGWPKNVE